MEIHQLEYVLAVEKYRHFSLAAEEINISQPTLSHQIKKLEAELGVELFVRTTRSVLLTPAGEEFITYAKRILADIENAKNAMHEYGALKVGNIKIGAVPNINYLGITSLIAQFKKSYPGININLIEDNSEALLKLMNTHEVDLAFVNSPALQQDSYDYYPLVEDEFVLLVSRENRIAKENQLKLVDLSNEKFILFKMGTVLRNQFSQLCENAGFKPDVIFESSHMETMKGLVEEDVGILLSSKRAALAMVSSKTVVINVTPTIERITGLVVSKHSNLLVKKEFRDFILSKKSFIENSGK